MQKFLLTLLVAISCNFLFAQTVDDIKDFINRGQWDKAKIAVDVFLTKEKNAAKWEGWWYKGVIYNEIAKSEQFKNLVADGRMEAFNAFKKYYEIETKALQGSLEQHVRLFDIYGGYFDSAAANFNAKKYTQAYTNFKNAYTIEEFIVSKGFEYNNFKFPEFDTTLIQNIALSAYMAKKDDDASIYYNKIAEKKIAGKGNQEVYQFLVEYYNKKKDIANRQKYIQVGRELYPDDDFWYLTEIADVDEKNKRVLFAKYAELTKIYTNKPNLYYNYGVELYNYAYDFDKKPADYKDLQKKIEEVLKQALKINKNYTEASMLMSMHLYNTIFDFQDEMKLIKGNSAAEQKKRTDLKTQMITKADEMIPYALTVFDALNAMTSLKPNESGNLRKITDFLVSAYEIKGDKAKADEYKKKLEGKQN
jgi:hypothetical protein